MTSKRTTHLSTPLQKRRALFRLAAAAGLSASGLPASHAAAGDDVDRRRGERLWAGPFTATRVWGYADRHSVKRGQAFDLMLSTGPSNETLHGRLEFYRIGHAAKGRGPTWTSPSIALSRHAVSPTAASVGANWPPVLRGVDTTHWPPGYYTADFIESATANREPNVAQIIVCRAERSASVLLKFSTNTYQAYNPWGGHSLYPTPDDETNAFMVSFDRPTPPAVLEYEVFLATWLEALGERKGFEVDYASNFDVHHKPGLLDNYRLVISGSHDEYWSKEEFDSFEQRIFRSGKNTLFLGGNSAYWQIRYVDVNSPPEGDNLGRQLLTYKSLLDPIARRDCDIDPSLLVTARFRDDARRPESMLMGVAYENWFQPDDQGSPRVPYFVATTDSPFFEGTGYRKGDIAADVIGYEWDNRDPQGDGNRLWSSGRSRNELLPVERLRVLFQGAARGMDDRAGRAEAVYFESEAGAKVFSAGSIRWVWGLGKPGFESNAFKRFNENLVTAMI